LGRRAASLVALVLTVLLGAAPAASAESAAQVRDLAQQAKHDPNALDRLKQVAEVDGRPVDFRTALDGASGPDLDRRLDEIASATGGPSADGEVGALGDPGEGARRDAERILTGRRFRPSEPPRPLAGVIHRLGQWLQPVLKPLGRLLAPVGRLLVRIWHNAVLVGLLAMAVIATAALFSLSLIRRRGRAVIERSGDADGERVLDPRQLEREADAAEAAGDLERAVRLRFLAGVLRLDRAGALRYRPSLTTGEVVRTVRSHTLRTLAGDFDEIAYGGRPPAPDDVARAKAEWPRVLDEAKR
jgi:hypothetical protein